MTALGAATETRPDKTWYLERLRVAACMAVALIHCFATELGNASVSEVGVWRASGWTEALVFPAASVRASYAKRVPVLRRCM